MRMSREERGRMHKEKCRELKQIRAKMAEDLGIELHQSECTYEGYCSGTCPKCRSEELQLNAAIMKKQMEEINLKGRVAAAGLTTVAALCLSGCSLPGRAVLEGEEQPLEGATVMVPETEDFLEGDIEYIPDTEEAFGKMGTTGERLTEQEERDGEGVSCPVVKE